MEGDVQLAGFQADYRKGRRTKPRALPVVTVVCLVLLALLTFAQIAHVHQVDTDADHCPLCIVMHAAAPVAVAAIVVVLVQIENTAPVFEPLTITRYWHPKLLTRPPPIGC
jgi:amino acid transporter